MPLRLRRGRRAAGTRPHRAALEERMLRIGLTGGMGTGKSEAAARLEELGAHVIEADRLAHELVEPGHPVLERLVERFGAGILDGEGGLDRRALAELAFASEESTRALNETTHPALVDAIVRRVEEAERDDPDGVVVVDAALLVQWDVLDMFDVVLLVTAPTELRVERLVRAGYSDEDVAARMRSQLGDAEMLAAADVVIENDGTLEELRSAVDTFWSTLPAEPEEQR